MPRQTKYSVTCFLNCCDKWLFIKRDMDCEVDPGKLNGVGGKVDAGENYVQAAIREIEEETGYVITEKDMQLSAVVHLREGYADDWMMCFFRVTVNSLNIPMDKYNGEGELVWLTVDEVLAQKDILVDDLNYTFEDIVAGKQIIFMNAVIDDNDKVKKIEINKI